ncbi:radical SAM protein [Labilibaculum sp. DW002]|uniref:Radical SAM protein n=1 Tax=Paralabilibaculum antarcticum TaxID=2912572 RepID=A0ABT5VNQ7_9BACT|nr:radical SAM protein [Labilibaculum sp. DW002]MDE5417069.1 radical SAM protein [Labilibaculum sp. DW002]
MYKYLFGPVPSRRLGMSLGVDLVPKKVCSLDCVYCEVGKTTKLSLERKEYINADCIKDELTHYLKNNPSPDYITITASGEPTLNQHLGAIIDFIKQTKADIPVALITNGSLLYDPEVRKEMMKADLLLPSLDAATNDVFKKINRPAEDLTVEMCIEGIISLRKEFEGKIWLEVFILPGYNDSKEELTALKEVILKVNPDSIHLNTLDRPGTVANLRGASREELQRVVDFWQMDKVEIVAKLKQVETQQTYRKDTASAILETVARRPCTLEDLTKMLGLKSEEIEKQLKQLIEECKLESVAQDRGVFYQLLEKDMD